MEEKKSGFMNFIEEKVSPLAAKVAGEKHLMAIRDGLAQIIPLVIVGSVFILLQALPIPGYDKFMKGIFGASYIIKLGYAINGTFSLIALVSVFTIAYNLARNYNQNGMSAGLLSLAVDSLDQRRRRPIESIGQSRFVCGYYCESNYGPYLSVYDHP
jgi:PTS system cellobiose-specific IIC component